MGYEILYHRFSVYDPEKKTLTPYIIHGSNNCYYPGGKRERNLTNLQEVMEKYLDFDQKHHTCQMFITACFNQLKPDIETGYWRRVPKTLNGFSGMFYDKIISKENFDRHYNHSDALFIDEYLQYAKRWGELIDFDEIRKDVINI